jgi:hypothetical protein
MTDDIVARLREFAGPQYPDDICGKAAMGEAADEIERLRADMRKITAVNSKRDRYSSEIDLIITEALND